jgi:hypothetical protein
MEGSIMAKKEIRLIVASESQAAIIDHGADVDTQIKNLSYEDKGIKAKIRELAEKKMNEGEKSVRISGEKSLALVSVSQKVELDVSAEKFPLVKSAVDKGFLGGIVVKEFNVVIPSADLVRAAAVLKAAGIQATLEETLGLNKAVFDEMAMAGVSQEEANARAALKESVSKSETFRIAYERKQ